nr:protein spinster homolog 1-like [Rhipicephalus microplus]
MIKSASQQQYQQYDRLKTSTPLGAVAMTAPSDESCLRQLTRRIVLLLNTLKLFTMHVPTSYRVNRIFGIITSLAGIVGVATGSALSAHFRKWSVRADAFICGGGMLISVPLLFVGATIAHRMPTVTWVLFFFGMTAICLNWSIVADILLYILVPSRRATGAAFQILISHLLGDASSPYIVGVIYDAILVGRTDVAAHYFSLQYALFLPVAVLVLGSLFFVVLSWHIVADREDCAALTREMLKGSSCSFDDPLDRGDMTSCTVPLLEDRVVRRKERVH